MEAYINRSQAGKILAKELETYAKRPDVIVLALPRGGVPVAWEIAKSLDIPMNVFIVRKLGVPGHAECAMGAIASGDVMVLNEELISQLQVSKSAIEAVIKAEKEELGRRELLYSHNQPLPSLEGKTLLLVDDGIATGATMEVAVKALRQKKPASIIIAVPVAALESYNKLAKEADQIICPVTPLHFQAIGLWYVDFSQTSDAEVAEILVEAQRQEPG